MKEYAAEYLGACVARTRDPWGTSVFTVPLGWAGACPRPRVRLRFIPPVTPGPMRRTSSAAQRGE